MSDQASLRRRLCAQRAALPAAAQYQAANGLRQALITTPLFQHSRHIACYLATQGEIDPHLVIEAAWQQGKTCYLPVLSRDAPNSLRFMPYRRTTKLTKNRYGIFEPPYDASQSFTAEQLDLVLAPLVAVDREGNRLGMGKGYYDRTFAFLRQRARPGKPLLIGLAHRFQQLPQIAANPWDVALDGVANETGLTLFG